MLRRSQKYTEKIREDRRRSQIQNVERINLNEPYTRLRVADAASRRSRARHALGRGGGCGDARELRGRRDLRGPEQLGVLRVRRRIRRRRMRAPRRHDVQRQRYRGCQRQLRVRGGLAQQPLVALGAVAHAATPTRACRGTSVAARAKLTGRRAGCVAGARRAGCGWAAGVGGLACGAGAARRWRLARRARRPAASSAARAAACARPAAAWAAVLPDCYRPKLSTADICAAAPQLLASRLGSLAQRAARTPGCHH